MRRMTDAEFQHLCVERSNDLDTREIIQEAVRARESEARLLAALQAFPGFTDDARVGDPWIEQARAAIAEATK